MVWTAGDVRKSAPTLWRKVETESDFGEMLRHEDARGKEDLESHVALQCYYNYYYHYYY